MVKLELLILNPLIGFTNTIYRFETDQYIHISKYFPFGWRGFTDCFGASATWDETPLATLFVAHFLCHFNRIQLDTGNRITNKQGSVEPGKTVVVSKKSEEIIFCNGGISCWIFYCRNSH